MPAAKKTTKKAVDLTVVEKGEFEACLLGSAPIWLHSLNSKTKKELLFPPGTKSKAQKQSTLKHDPLEEYRTSPYRNNDPKAETYIEAVAAGIKFSMAQIALDLPDTGTSKAQLLRLLFAPQEKIPIWGVPTLGMVPVRMADQNRTPDIRTRAVIRHWATKVRIAYVKPVLRQEVVVKILSAAGFMGGIGDWRAGKGNGNFGTFDIVKPDDPRFLHILQTGGREAQLDAMRTPDFYDDDSRELYEWFIQEVIKRGFSEKLSLKAEEQIRIIEAAGGTVLLVDPIDRENVVGAEETIES
jgi:hypothetical protein